MHRKLRISITYKNMRWHIGDFSQFGNHQKLALESGFRFIDYASDKNSIVYAVYELFDEELFTSFLLNENDYIHSITWL